MTRPLLRSLRLAALCLLPLTPLAPLAAQEPPAAQTGTIEVRAEDWTRGLAVMTGRVATLRLDEMREVEILSGPDIGHASVNPDGSVALVLTGTDATGDTGITLRLTHADGSAIDQRLPLRVMAGAQAGGWGLGDVYMLETDETGAIRVEPGRHHRRVYVSGGPNALTLADIAARAGVKPGKGAPWRKIFAENPQYGASPQTALSEEAGDILWRSLVQGSAGPKSHWLLLDRGYRYDRIKLLHDKGDGETPLHPLYIGAYGSGARPMIAAPVKTIAKTRNVVIQGLAFSNRLRLFNVSNYLLDDILVTGREISLRNVTRLTLRRAVVFDVAREAPVKNATTWGPHANRISGIFMTKSRGILLEQTLFDHNGWAEGYDPALSGRAPQPPSMFSHNIYFAADNHDITLRDSIVMRGAANGAQLRSGGMIEDTVFIDNNGALMFGRGGKEMAGTYTLVNGVVVTSGAHKETEDGTGALSVGLTNQGALASLTGAIVTHLADPDDPAEAARKRIAQPALQHRSGAPFHDDTIVYGWVGSRTQDKDGLSEDRNLQGRDRARMQATTIQRFAATALGKPGAGITELGRALRARAIRGHGPNGDADTILAFFRAGFGLSDPEPAAGLRRFVPDALAEGMRWDNRLNWTGGTLPADGDRVALAGNRVRFGGTITLAGLDLGEDGALGVAQGRLRIDGPLSAGARGAGLRIARAGQLWADGYDGPGLLRIAVPGGRLINEGTMAGPTDLTVSGLGQAILATDGAAYVMPRGSSLTVAGASAQVGFDGRGIGPAVLRMTPEATLALTSAGGELGEISEIVTGAFGRDAPRIRSGVDLGGGRLRVDISGLIGTAAATYRLVQVDALIGTPGAVEIPGLGDARDATIIVDHRAGRLVLRLGVTGAGRGTITVETVGTDAEATKEADLRAALTAPL